MDSTVKAAQRKFEGPFLILGISPHWPEELERRTHNGPHSRLEDIRPLAALQAFDGVAQETLKRVEDKAIARGLLKPYAPPAVKSSLRPAVVQVAPTHRKDLAKPLTDRFLDQLENAARFMDGKPRTARQLARHCGCSEPTVYAILDVLSRRGFPLRKEKREGKRAALWSLAYAPAKTPRAKA